MNASSGLSRRGFLGSATAAGAGAAVARLVGSTSASAAVPPGGGGAPGVTLHWLEGVPRTTTGSTWGVPWPKGQVGKHTRFALSTSAGAAVPVQTRALAFWPDGSVKWTGHSIAADTGFDDTLLLTRGQPAAPRLPVSVRRDGDAVVVDNGLLEVRLSTHGSGLIQSVSRAGRTTAQAGRLIARVQDQPDGEGTDPRLSSWIGVVTGATIEQSGPVTAVVKLHGHYVPAPQAEAHHLPRTLFPWTVRISLSAGAESLRIVHSFVWDADPGKVFVKGMGLDLEVPMTDEAHNRHVRFAGADRGVWGEPVRVLTGLRRDPGADVNAAQVAGTATPPVSAWAAQVAAGYTELALWNDFTLTQDTASHFAVWKRTNAQSSWLKDAGHGDRSPGLGYVGGVSGGVAFGLRDFWQRFPRALDVRDAASPVATATLWSWSPYAPAMDMRPYDTVGHGLDLAYEDNREGFGDPRGITRSTDMELWVLAATPTRERFADLALALATPPQLAASPQTLHAAGVFGRWSLPDRSTSARAVLEDSIETSIDFYAGQIDQREWYGFWEYGDVMHTYDADRHSWRYDVGGFGWDNAELGFDAMLWYSFLRSGKATTFRLARALTHHVSETDSYLTGKFAGLGSRHNVSNWGDGAKEARVGESYTRRFLYYLTADEFIGDHLRASLQADHTLLNFEPLRDILPPQTKAPTRLRIGPDWYALVSNWLTEWERTGDTRWRDRIVTGMRDIATFPAGLFTGEGGGAVGFDPVSAHLVNLDSPLDYKGGYNLAMAFLGDQILFETLDLVDVPEFRAVLLDFARYVQAPSAEKIARYGFDFDPGVFKTIYSRLTAWAGEQLGDPAISQRGWDQLAADPAGAPWPAAQNVAGTAVLTPVDEIPLGDFATNDVAQRNLAIVELLAIAPAEAP